MHILIVDNDSRIVELVTWFLRERGFEVQSAESFADARHLIDDRRPDLLLSDIDLGAEDGREELWALARGGVLPRTLVVSGYLSPEVHARLQGLPGLVGTLAKPFDFEELEARVRGALAAPLPASSPSTVGGPDGPPEGSDGPPEGPGPGDVAAVEDDEGWIEIGPTGGGPA